jgi:hypothetical protein
MTISFLEDLLLAEETLKVAEFEIYDIDNKTN